MVIFREIPRVARDKIKHMNNIYDTIIIGSGPGGMTAGIYTARRAMKTLILGKDLGGQMSKTLIVENHPGVKTSDGISIAMQIQEQAKSFGVEFESEKVKTIEREEKLFNIKTESGKVFNSKSVILAFGLEKRKLNLQNEEKIEGRGLSYCVTCDGPMFKNKINAVVGGGNSGAEAVEFLSKISTKVYWIEVMEKINADKILQDRISKLENVEIMTNTKVTKLIGAEKLEEIIIEKNDPKSTGSLDPARDRLRVAGVFVEIGYVSQSEWLDNFVELDNFGQIKINNLCHTNQPGVFAIGDCTEIKYKQIVIAEGMGAIAGLESYSYVNKSNNKNN